MKKIISALAVFVMMLCLVACTNTTPNDPPVDPPDDEKDPGVTNTFEYKVLICAPNSPALGDIVNAIYEKSNKTLFVMDDTNTPIKGEIVFGKADRDVTEKAMGALDMIVGETDADIAAYAIYKAPDGNVAVVWNDVLVIDKAFNAFKEEFSDLTALAGKSAGVLKYETVNVDEYLYEATWGKIEKEAPKEVFDALKKLNKYYDGTAIVTWMANLYEPYICACGECDPDSDTPSCYGGGFYYANSARDYTGFLPDLESTYYIINWLKTYGAYTDSLQNSVPADVQEHVLKFVQACQSDDGYFYHPQWGSKVPVDRKGRDYSWGSSLLKTFGTNTAATASTVKVTSAASTLTMPLGGSVAEMVSYVAPVDAFDDALASKETFLEWLRQTTNGDGMFDNSAGAHVINAVQDRIQEAGYLEVTLDFLDERQATLFKEMEAAHKAYPTINPEPTGLWQRTVDYNAVWGLLKFATFYSRGNREIKYAEYAMKTCVGAIMIDADEGGDYHMNDVYNQWSSASNLINNAKTHNPSVVPRLYEIAEENVVEMLNNTMAKLEKFRHEDGSYGYNQGTSAPTVYGTTVSLGLPEGDVNATNLASSMYRSVFIVLGYDLINICDYRDGELFNSLVADMPTAYFDKIYVEPPKPWEFEEKPEDMEEQYNNGSSEIVTDPQKSGNKVLKVDCLSHSSSGDWIIFKPEGKDNANTCFVMEFDIMIEAVRGTNWTGNILQIRIGESYMIEIYKSGDKIKVRDNTTTANLDKTTDLNMEFDLNTWVNIRLEYYVDAETPIIKTFLNDTLTATSTNYYTASSSNGKPRNIYTQARFMALKATDATFYLDNTLFMCDRKDYTDSDKPYDYLPNV